MTPARRKRCKYCDVLAFYWKDFSTAEDRYPQWRLVDAAGELHVCPERERDAVRRQEELKATQAAVQRLKRTKSAKELSQRAVTAWRAGKIDEYNLLCTAAAENDEAEALLQRLDRDAS